MLIGELARRTGTSQRLLRYYERVGLLTADRRSNGYRTYDESVPTTVLQIRALLAAGLSTRVIGEILPCTTAEAHVLPCPGVLNSLHDQLRALDQRSAEIDAARTALRQTIATTAQAAANQRQNGN